MTIEFEDEPDYFANSPLGQIYADEIDIALTGESTSIDR